MDAVRDAWNAYREQCSDWQFKRWRVGFEGEIFEGWFLEPRSLETLLLIGDALMRCEWREPKFSMTASEAKDALWDAIRRAGQRSEDDRQAFDLGYAVLATARKMAALVQK